MLNLSRNTNYTGPDERLPIPETRCHTRIGPITSENVEDPVAVSNPGDSILEIDTPAPVKRNDRFAPWLQIGAIHRYGWSRHVLPIGGLPPALNGFRILHFSDLHLCPDRWHPGLDRVVEQVQHDEPDLICITGDFIDDRHDPRPAATLVERFTTQLRARLGIFAILGNHDGDLLGPRMPNWGVRLITGERIELQTETGGVVELIGLAGVHREDLFLETFTHRLSNKRAGSLRITLSHYPDALPRLEALRTDLFLAGHTHGGQICLPGGVPLLTHDALPRRYSRGVHRIDSSWVSISRGMGYTNQPMRLFAPAEVVELQIAAAQE